MTTSAELIEWPITATARHLRRRVIALLERGELIVIPTETVYGVAARADDERALERLRAFKRRGSEQAFTWHVGDVAALERFDHVSSIARRLARKYWPGPLTLILPGVPRGLEGASRGGFTGVRLPAHAATAALLAEAPFPIVATSVNRHGEPPVHEPSRIASTFGDEVAAVLDGGEPRLKEGSVVLKVGPGAFELVRPGIIDIGALRRAAGLRIAFVCTGNTCRSPMAEHLARDLVAKRLEVPIERLDDFGFEFVSMGILAHPGAPASMHAVTVLKGEGIDLSEHAARAVAAQDLASFDRVYAMTAGHLQALTASQPPTKAAHCALLDPQGRDIGDPVGGTLDDYRQCAAQIRAAIEARAREWI